MNKWILLLCGALAIGSCTDSKNGTGEYMSIDLAPLLAKGGQPVIKLEDWAKSVRYVQLETNDSILIRYINQLYYYNDRFLVQHSHRVSIFDKDGKYLFDPAKQGGGPNEYATNRETRVNNRMIYIEDSPRRIKTYDWEGNFLKTIPLPGKNIYGFLPLPEKNIILGHRVNLDGTQPTRLYFCRDTAVIDSIPNYKTYPQAPISMQISNDFGPLAGNKVQGFKELLNDTVYRIGNELELIPYAVIHTGEYGATPERRYSLTIEDIKNDNMWQGKSIIYSLGDAGDNFYLTEDNKERSGNVFYYDRKERQAKGVRLLISNDDLDISPDTYFVPTTISDDNKYLVGWVQPENDNNPVLIIVEP